MKIDIPGITKPIDKAIWFWMLFTAAAILISMWLGYFWRDSLAIAIASVLVAGILYKKFRVQLKVPWHIYALAALMFLILVYPELLIHQFYPATADAAQTITVRVIGERIPLTYAPYSGISLGYYLGFHVFARLFVDLLPALPDYLWVWLLGAVFASLELVFVYLFGREFFGGGSAGTYAAILFLGTRSVFQNFYWAMHPMVLGMLFLMAASFLYMKKNPLCYPFFGITLMLHTGAAVNAFILFLGLLLYFREPIKKFLGFAVSCIASLPAVFTTYYILFVNLLAGTAFESSGSGLESITVPLAIAPLWVGIVPSLAFAGALLFYSARRRMPNRAQCLMLAIGIAAFAIYLFSSFLRGKAASLLSLAVIFFVACALSGLKISPRAKKALMLALLIASLASFFFSANLDELRQGTKITPDEADFAFEFRERAPELSTALFLTQHPLKIAEYSNKIPFDVLGDYPVGDVFLAYGEWQTLHDASYSQMSERHAVQLRISGEGCVECIYGLDVDYAVIDRRYFSRELDAELFFAYGQFEVYRLNR